MMHRHTCISTVTAPYTDIHTHLVTRPQSHTICLVTCTDRHTIHTDSHRKCTKLRHTHASSVTALKTHTLDSHRETQTYSITVPQTHRCLFYHAQACLRHAHTLAFTETCMQDTCVQAHIQMATSMQTHVPPFKHSRTDTLSDSHIQGEVRDEVSCDHGAGTDAM